MPARPTSSHTPHRHTLTALHPHTPPMRAMILSAPGQPLTLVDLPVPQPNSEQVLIRVHTCAVCRTDLHIVDGELPHPQLPLILGHQIIGTIVAMGDRVQNLSIGQRIGVPWLGYTCGQCRYCLSSRENLCDRAAFTGYNLNGGYAEYTVADHRFCFSLHPSYSDFQAAPLLCGGLIGYRAYSMTGDAQTLGFYGFGSSAHMLIQLARYQGRQVYAFTRTGDVEGQAFARQLGATWAGDSELLPPTTLDAAIIFAPVGKLVPTALRAVGKAGVVVCAGIHMSDIPAFPYEILWQERVLRSVANLTRRDGEEFLALAPLVPIHTEVHAFPLTQANAALNALRTGKITGSAVLMVA